MGRVTATRTDVPDGPASEEHQSAVFHPSHNLIAFLPNHSANCITQYRPRSTVPGNYHLIHRYGECSAPSPRQQPERSIGSQHNTRGRVQRAYASAPPCRSTFRTRQHHTPHRELENGINCPLLATHHARHRLPNRHRPTEDIPAQTTHFGYVAFTPPPQIPGRTEQASTNSRLTTSDTS